MASSTQGYERPVVLGAVRHLVRESRAARAALASTASERDFYLGVQAAAEEVLYPELSGARPKGFLDRESRNFREGYVRTKASLGAALTAGHAPVRFRLPEPPPDSAA